MILHFLWRRRFGLLIVALGFILILTLLVATLPLLPAKAVPDWLEPIAEVVHSPQFGAYAALFEIGLVLAGVALTAYHFRHQRAAAFIERFNTPDVMDMRDKIDRWLGDYEESPLRKGAQDSSVSLSEEDGLRLTHMEARLLLELERDPELDKAVKSFANLFQELGEARENRTASPSYTRRMFDHLAPHYWSLLRFWVEDYRLRKSPTLYRRFENLAETLATPGSDKKAPKEEEATPASERARARRALLDRVEGTGRTFIFGYGSLIYSRSRAHVSTSTHVAEARLRGYLRAWNVIERIRSNDDGDSAPDRSAVFLDLVLAPSGHCNGVVVEVDEAQLMQSDKRERSYFRVDVTSWIDDGGSLPPGAVVYTYIGRPECTVSRAGDRKLYLPMDYKRLLEAGLEERLPGFKDAFWGHTLPPPSSAVRLGGAYQFVDPAQNCATGRDQPGGP